MQPIAAIRSFFARDPGSAPAASAASSIRLDKVTREVRFCLEYCAALRSMRGDVPLWRSSTGVHPDHVRIVDRMVPRALAERSYNWLTDQVIHNRALRQAVDGELGRLYAKQGEAPLSDSTEGLLTSQTDDSARRAAKKVDARLRDAYPEGTAASFERRVGELLAEPLSPPASSPDVETQLRGALAMNAKFIVTAAAQRLTDRLKAALAAPPPGGVTVAYVKSEGDRAIRDEIAARLRFEMLRPEVARPQSLDLEDVEWLPHRTL